MSESNSGGVREKETKMEITPQPEMGQGWGWRCSVTRVSTPPLLLVQQVHSKVNMFVPAQEVREHRQACHVIFIYCLDRFIGLDLVG